MFEDIKKITLEDVDSILNIEVPDNYNAYFNNLQQKRIVTCGGVEGISGRSISVILVAPKDIDMAEIMVAIDNVINPIKLSVSDLKFYSTDEAYVKYRSDRKI